jgi:hypothetical protein
MSVIDDKIFVLPFLEELKQGGQSFGYEKEQEAGVWDNSTKLIRIVFETEKPILYVGSVKELIYSRKFLSFFFQSVFWLDVLLALCVMRSYDLAIDKCIV